MSKNRKQQEENSSKSLYEKIKEADNSNKWTGGTMPISGFYEATGLSGMSKDPMKLYDSADKLIERYERWAKNWRQLKKDCVKDILSKFSREELQEALNNK